MIQTDWLIVAVMVALTMECVRRERKMMNNKKPLLGIIPERFWKEDRLKELERAISERIGTFCDIPLKWVIERNQLLGELEGLRAIK